jgi:hypothetical protein
MLRISATSAEVRLTEALFDSEDSSTVNTSFVERLNLSGSRAGAVP